MKSNSKTLGDIIKAVDERNSDEKTKEVLGISINKEFMPSVANIIGTDLSKYKLLRKSRFAFNSMHTGRDERLPIALFKRDDIAIVSPAYFMFEIKSKDEVDEDYLMIWFQRPEFDHVCWYMTDASVRGGLSWDDFCRISIELPSIEEQRKIVHDYKVITNRIELLKKINENLLIQMDAIYSDSLETENETIKLNNFLNFQEGPGIRNWQFVDEGIPFINIRCIQDGDISLETVNKISIEEAKTTYAHFMLKEGDFVVSVSGTLGKNAIVRKEHLPLCLNTSIIRFSPKNSVDDYATMICLIRSKKFVEDMYSVATGSAQVNMGPMQLNKMDITIPKNRPQLSKIIIPMLNIEINNKKELGILDNLKKRILLSLTSEKEVG